MVIYQIDNLFRTGSGYRESQIVKVLSKNC
jgi:hypothetical protein